MYKNHVHSCSTEKRAKCYLTKEQISALFKSLIDKKAWIQHGPEKKICFKKFQKKKFCVRWGGFTTLFFFRLVNDRHGRSLLRIILVNKRFFAIFSKYPKFGRWTGLEKLREEKKIEYTFLDTKIYGENSTFGPKVLV